MNPGIDDLAEDLKILTAGSERGLASHPSAETLTAYHLGELADDEASQLQGHLAVCQECTPLLLDLAEMLDPSSTGPGNDWAQAWPAVQNHLFAERNPATQPEIPTVHSPTPLHQTYALAAVLTLAVLGLGGWNLSLRRALEQSAEPRANVEIHDLLPSDFARADRPAEAPLELVRTQQRSVLILNPSVNRSGGSRSVRIVDEGGREVWRSEGLEPTAFGNYTLELSHDFLAAGVYRVELLAPPGERQPDIYSLTLKPD